MKEAEKAEKHDEKQKNDGNAPEEIEGKEQEKTDEKQENDGNAPEETKGKDPEKTEKVQLTWMMKKVIILNKRLMKYVKYRMSPFQR